MKAFYKKNELGFSLVAIAAYVVLFSLADGLSQAVGVEKLFTAVFSMAASVFLLGWIGKNGLLGKYGLEKKHIDGKKYLYFLPLALIISANLWCGVTLRLSLMETALYIVAMLGVGIIEEVIFRGFLFRALCKENVKTAVIVSSITFGMGHIVNLLNGAAFVPTLLQILYASAIGFLFTVIVYKENALLPCIITHSAVNALSVFARDRSMGADIAVAVLLMIIPLLYAWWILKKTGPMAAETK
ncbi:MAG: CPBP family intramembrane metalloprotease [Clostridiales bacterium]|nr:CPBP family intramembrane metalloprotease [Clostridiales bacterium]